MQVAKTVNERISKYAQVTLESCAYAGTGNVLKVQQLLAQAGEHIELKEDESWKVTRGMTRCTADLVPSCMAIPAKAVPAVCFLHVMPCQVSVHARF